MLAPPEDDMSSASPVTPIGPSHGVELRLRKMLASRTTMPGSAEYPDLVYKV